MIEKLVLLTPDGDRAERTLTRCHERLALRRRKQARRDQWTARVRIFEPVLVAGLCVLHLLAVADHIIRVRGMF